MTNADRTIHPVILDTFAASLCSHSCRGALLQSAAVNAADLTVVVTNIKLALGPIRVGVFKDPAPFPKADHILVSKAVASAPGEVAVVFEGLEPGSYAGSAIHDLDDNGKLNRNLFGVPSEPYGFSRGARGRTGSPSFDDAKIAVWLVP